MNNTEYITFCILITEIMIIIMDCKCYIEYRKEKEKRKQMKRLWMQWIISMNQCITTTNKYVNNI